jgi:hypothetical protein
VRVPEQAAAGTAKVRLSFDAWKQVKVKPWAGEVPVVEKGPEDKKR